MAEGIAKKIKKLLKERKGAKLSNEEIAEIVNTKETKSK